MAHAGSAPPILWSVAPSALGLVATEYASSVTADLSGNVYITGSSDSGSRGFYAAISPAGAVTRIDAWSGTGVSVAVDGVGHIYVGGTTAGNRSIRKYAAAGALLWTRTDAGGLAAVAADGTGVYVGGGSGMEKYSSAGGSKDWSRTGHGGLGSVDDMITDGAGSVYLRGDLGVERWTANGDFVWQTLIGSSGSSEWNPRIRLRGDGSPVIMAYLGYDASAARMLDSFVHLAGSTGLEMERRDGGSAADFVMPGPTTIVQGYADSLMANGWDAGPAYQGTGNLWLLPGLAPAVAVYPSSRQHLAAGPRGEVYAVGYASAALFAVLDPIADGGPKKGTIRVRGNVIRIRHGDVAYITVSGSAPHVGLELFDASGNSLGALGDTALAGDGRGVVSFDGKVNGRPLRSGVYWIATQTAVRDRAPIVIVNE